MKVIPKREIIKDGRIDFTELARVQRVQHPLGTGMYNRYKKYWEDTENQFTGLGQETVSHTTEQLTRLTDEQDHQCEEDEENQVTTAMDVYYSGDSDEVWIGLKLGEEDGYYTLKDNKGDRVNETDLEEIKQSDDKYEVFEYLCWSEFLGNDVGNQTELYSELSGMLEMPLPKIRGARVDSMYDEVNKAVVISFKVKIEK